MTQRRGKLLHASRSTTVKYYLASKSYGLRCMCFPPCARLSRCMSRLCVSSLVTVSFIVNEVAVAVDCVVVLAVVAPGEQRAVLTAPSAATADLKPPAVRGGDGRGGCVARAHTATLANPSARREPTNTTIIHRPGGSTGTGEHGRRRGQCKACGGGNICEHNGIRHQEREQEMQGRQGRQERSA